MDTVKITCETCGKSWQRDVADDERIGYYGQLTDGALKSANTVVKTREGYGTYSSIECSVCGRTTDHDISVIEDE